MLKIKNKTICLSGSITVEAAFIIPIVLTVLFILCYMTFYLHDCVRIQCIMNQETGRQSAMGSILSQEKEEKEKLLRDYLQKEFQKKLFMIHPKKIEIQITNTSINAQVIGKSRVSLGLVNIFFTKYIQITSKSNQYQPADIIRTYSIWKELIQGIGKKE